MVENIKYVSPYLAEYFINNRRKWDEFYTSERWVFSKVGDRRNGFGHVLDVGCAVGGLGNALSEKYTISSYTGLDINEQAIDYARAQHGLSIESSFLCDDIVTSKALEGKLFDTVFALSVADWNVDTSGILKSCWAKVKPGGQMILSQRLTNESTISDQEISYQYIIPSNNYDVSEEKSALDKAPYVVLNVKDCLNTMLSLIEAPSDILAYGYWGLPSKTATTPLKKIAFAVFCITKSENEQNVDNINIEAHLPANLFC